MPARRYFFQQFIEAFAARHAAARRAARGDLDDLDLLRWGQSFLPQHFARPPSLMHRWLAAQLGRMHTRRGMKLNVLGPRGGAKSTLGSLAFALRAALEAAEPYIWIVSDTRHQAEAHLENIKAELVGNPKLAMGYPSSAGRGQVWRTALIVLRNGVAVEALGTGQRIRGRRRRAHRPTLIIADDLQNDSHMRSALQRDHSRQWFHGTLLKAGTPRTNVLNLATALHHDALAVELCRTPGWTSRVFRAVVRWPTHMELWQKWEAMYANAANPHAAQMARDFYLAHQQPMHEGALLLWPEEEDLYTLMCLRAESGREAFEREKQNSPIDPESCEWPETYFGENTCFDDWPARLLVRAMALDPSKGADARRGDYSAFVWLGVDRQGLVYVDADLRRRPTPEMVADGVEHVRRFQPHVFAVEANQFQDLLAGEFEAAFRRAGLTNPRPYPIENHVPKAVRIRRLGPYLASRRLRFRNQSPGAAMLVEQLQQFPAADHDDGPDALEMALRVAVEVLAGRARADGLGNRLPVNVT
ncbi:MAG: hypothetical protein ACOY3P_16020 [Planctomycetota bacterium]